MLLASSARAPEVDAAARGIISTYFGAPPGSDGSLPDHLARWVRHQEATLHNAHDASPAREPLRIERDGTALSVRFFSGPTQRLLLLEERRCAPDFRRLETLRVTRREAEVLRWVAAGKTNQEIATILGLSARTVAKHLERMYPRLGVENRTAAAARALEVLREGSDERS